jgi:hypothetical protein
MSIPKLISLAFVTAIAAVFVFSCSNPDAPDLPPIQSETDDSSSSVGGEQNQSSGSVAITGFYGDDVFIDPRDGKEYKYEIRATTTRVARATLVVAGVGPSYSSSSQSNNNQGSRSQVWMKGNLNYSRDNTLGYCYGVDIYGENPHRDSLSCGNGYGRTYDWTTAIDGVPPQGLCPPGWHIPSITEWDGLYGITHIYAGNYNLNTAWPPLGWKDRGEQAFYWTSSGYQYFAYVDSDPYFAGNPWSVENSASIVDMFSVRCIADELQNCNGNSYSIATHFCYADEAYIRCNNNSTYDATKYFCFGKKLYDKCGGQAYTPGEQECIGNTVFSKCGTTLYNPETHYCSGTTIVPK